MSMPSTLRPVAAALLLSALASQAYADDQWFLSAKDLKGDSLVDGRKGQVEVSGFHFGVTAESSWTKGGGASVGKPVPSAISWNQGWDSSVSTIYTDIWQGKALSGPATFELARSVYDGHGKVNSKVGFSSKAEGVFFTDVGMSLSSGYDVSAVAKTVEFSYDPTAWRGSGEKQTLKWDIPAGKADTLTAYKPPSTTGDHSAAGDGVKAYLRVGDSAGRSTAVGYENWTDVEDLSWDVTAMTSWLKGGGASVGKPNPGALSWSQSLDGSLLYELSGMLRGKSVPTLVVEYVRNGEHGPITFMQDVFADVYFTSIDINGTDVSNSVVFSSVTKTMWGTDNDGMRGNVQSSIKWDIPGGKVTTSGNSPVTTSLGYLGAGNLDGSPYALPMGGSLPPPVGVPVPVPEPETWALMLAGVLLLALRRRAFGAAEQTR